MRRSIIAVIASAILLLATPALGASKEDRENCNQTANHDLKIDGCTRVLNDREEPQAVHAIAYYLRGLAWQTKRDLDRAIADFDQVIRLDPENAAAHSNRGIAWYEKRDFDRAIADFDAALKIHPKLERALWGRGLAKIRKGDSAGGNADFAAAHKIRYGIADESAK